MKDVYLDEGMRGWIVVTSHNEHWRMASWYSIEDLIQDGFLCYTKCREYYKDNKDLMSDNPTPAQRRWFMSLVQATFCNHISSLAKKFMKSPQEDVVSQIVDENTLPITVFEKFIPPAEEEASIMVALAKLPTELADVLDRLTQDGFEGGAYLRHVAKPTKRRLRETTKEYWNRVLGQPDIPNRLAAYLNS